LPSCPGAEIASILAVKLPVMLSPNLELLVISTGGVTALYEVFVALI